MKNDGSYLIQLRELALTEDSKSNDESGSENPRLLPDSVAAAIKYNLLLKVRTLYGRTKLILSSPLQIENNSKVRLFILVELTDRNQYWKNTLMQELNRYEELSVQCGDSKRTFAVTFELLPDKVYYVPLIVAYNFKLYTTPNTNKYEPALVFDIRGYNLRIDDCSELSCKKIVDVSAPIKVQVDSGASSSENNQTIFDNDFYLIKQLSLNVKSHKNIMPAMHANYRVYFNDRRFK